MKKTLLAIACAAILLTGCIGNYELTDLKYTFDYAIINLPNGEIIEGEIDSWRDYEGEQLLVVIEGKSYIVSSYNCVLIRYEDTGVKW